MEIETSGSFSVHVCWTLCWWHDNFFVRGEEGSVLKKGGWGVDEGGGEEVGKGLLCWNFYEIF